VAEKPLPAAIGLRERRDATIARLCEHFALDNIDADKLERLIDRAHQSTSVAELDSLLVGLPSVQADSRPSPVPVSLGETEQSVVAIMGGAQRTGAWIVSRHVRVIAFMGGAMLDFRDVALPPGRTDLEVYAVWGGVEIILPPGLHVVSDGSGIMGGFDHAASGAHVPPDPNGSTLYIRGIALMGGVEITERLPGESAREAHRRRGEDRKLRREERRQDRALRRQS
jgi:hypothetical protein